MALSPVLDYYSILLFIFNIPATILSLAFFNYGSILSPPHKKLKEFLMKYLVLEEDFLKTVSDKAKFSDAEEVLTTYNDWKKKN